MKPKTRLSIETFFQESEKYIQRVRYEYGAVLDPKNPQSTDCSGFLYGLFAHLGITIPRCSIEQYEACEIIHHPTEKPNPEGGKRGDLLFWYGERPNKTMNINHVAVIEKYLGNQQYQTIESARSENGVARVVRTLEEKHRIGRFPFFCSP